MSKKENKKKQPSFSSVVSTALEQLGFPSARFNGKGRNAQLVSAGTFCTLDYDKDKGRAIPNRVSVSFKFSAERSMPLPALRDEMLVRIASALRMHYGTHWEIESHDMDECGILGAHIHVTDHSKALGRS